MPPGKFGFTAKVGWERGAFPRCGTARVWRVPGAGSPRRSRRAAGGLAPGHKRNSSRFPRGGYGMAGAPPRRRTGRSRTSVLGGRSPQGGVVPRPGRAGRNPGCWRDAMAPMGRAVRSGVLQCAAGRIGWVRLAGRGSAGETVRVRVVGLSAPCGPPQRGGLATNHAGVRASAGQGRGTAKVCRARSRARRRYRSPPQLRREAVPSPAVCRRGVRAIPCCGCVAPGSARQRSPRLPWPLRRATPRVAGRAGVPAGGNEGGLPASPGAA